MVKKHFSIEFLLILRLYQRRLVIVLTTLRMCRVCVCVRVLCCVVLCCVVLYCVRRLNWRKIIDERVKIDYGYSVW